MRANELLKDEGLGDVVVDAEGQAGILSSVESRGWK